MKKFLLTLSLCIPLTFLCSCSLFSSSNNKSSSSTQIDFNKNIDTKNNSVKLNLNKSVTVDAKLNIPKQLSSFKMNKVKAHRPLIDSEKAKDFFFKKGTHLTKQLDKGYSSREIGDYDIDLYYNADDSVLSCEKMDIIYTDFNIDSILKCVYTNPEIDSYNLDKYSLTDNLPFASREEVFQKIKNAYKTLSNVQISDDYQVYALDYKTLNKEEVPTDVYGDIQESERKQNWSHDDDTYYFILHQSINNVPIRQQGYGDGYDGTGVDDTSLEVYYSKNGWISFDERWAYIFEETTEEQTILNINEALNCLKRKYELIASLESCTFTEMNLELAPVFIKDNNYEIRPIWSFKKSQDSSSSSDTEVIFDGITGKELIQ